MEDASALTSLPDDPQTLKLLLIERDRHIVTLSRDRDDWKLKHDHKEIERLRLEVELLR